MAMVGDFNNGSLQLSACYALVRNISGGPPGDWFGNVLVYASKSDFSMDMRPVTSLPVNCEYIAGEDPVISLENAAMRQSGFISAGGLFRNFTREE